MYISHFIILNVLLQVRRSHMNTNTPNLADSLSHTNRMSVLLSPPQEVVPVFLGVSQMWLGSSSALASSLVDSLPGTAGENSRKKAAALLGTTLPCSVTVQCVETERISLDTTERNKLRSSTAQAQLSLKPLSSMSQPGATPGHTPSPPPTPTTLSPSFSSLPWVATQQRPLTCLHRYKKKPRKKEPQLNLEAPKQMKFFKTDVERGLIAQLFRDIQETLPHILFVLSDSTEQLKYN